MNDALAAALDGTTVVALATNIPAPVAMARLVAMGARATKIEPPRGDPLETAAPQWYAALHRGVRLERMDLSAAADRDALERLLQEADVLLTAIRASALQRAGLAWDALHARHPRLNVVAVFGETGARADRAGHDLTYQARAGLLAPPAMPRTLVADMAAAERAVTLALAALQARARDGCGRFTEVGIVDAAFEFALPLRYGLTGPAGVLGGALPAYRLYAAQEGWVALAALEGHFMERVRSLLGIDTLEESAIAAALAGKSAGEWERLASRADVPLAAVPTQAATGLRGIDATAATTGEDSN